MKKHLACLLALCFLCALPVRMVAQCHFLPIDSLPLPMQEPVLVAALQKNEACRQWVDSVMQTMSLKERIGQLFIYTIAPQTNQPNRNLLRKVVEEYKVGGLLFSGGLLENQVKLTNEAQQLAKVPLLITFDGEWGLAMRLRGMPSFPRNMVLGCIRSDSLLYEYGREVARQCREIGVQVNFAPVADVNINPDNPVINTRSFGEDPGEVARRVVAYSRGLESGRVLSVSKHFPGHGDTDVDSHKALPLLPFTRERLDSVELYPFRKAIRAGLGGIMVGHLEVPALNPQKGVPSSLSRRIVTGLLGEELGFKGLVFTDALAMRGVGNPGRLCLEALKAGDDLLLVPRALGGELEVVWKAVRKGELPEAEIKRNEELRPMMKPTTPPPPLKSTIKFTAPVIKKDEEVGEEDEIKSQDELAARGNVAISIADVKGNDEIDGQDIADFKDFVAPEVEEEEVYIIVEQMPGFPGGEEALMKYISDHVEYPAMAVERGIEGRVTVRFVVDKDGYVRDVTVIRGAHELLDREAVRVIQSLPRWNPGKQNGVAVAVYYNVPVNFALE